MPDPMLTPTPDDPEVERESPETLEQYGERIAAKTRKVMMDRLDDDVIGCLGQSHIIFGKACAMEAVTTAMQEMQAGIDQAKAATPRPAVEWRTIESAPKSWPDDVSCDDQAIQLWAQNIFGITRWTFGYWIERGPDGPGWWDCAERAFCIPTHWMPLPPAPALLDAPVRGGGDRG